MREVCGAGEPLNPEVIDQVRAAWGLTIRDGYGQTETTALAGNSPGQKVKVGSMGRPLPGYRVQITDSDGHVTKEGEVSLLLGADRPAGLMQGYQGDDGKLSGADGDLYRSGDVVFADDEGYLTFVGRSDDVFKSSDYRISPFELESILLEHECGRGGRGGSQPRSDPAGDPQGLCAAGVGRRAFAANRAVDLPASAHPAGAIQAHPADRTGDGIAEDDFRQNPPRAVAPAGARQ